MLYIIKWIYLWILPLGGIIAALIAVLIYMFRHQSRGRKGLLAVTLVLYALSLEPVGDALLWPLERQCSQPTAQEVQRDVIVLLGGGARAGVPDFDGTGQVGEAAANRFLTALRLQKALHLPIILSGGALLDGDANEAEIEKRLLLSLDVPSDMIYIDAKSRNTVENAAFTKALCQKNNWNHPIVVTSAFHMPRAVRFFAREEMDFTPYPCDYRASDSFHLSAYSIVPQAYILYHSCLAIKEYAGIAAAACRIQ